MRHRKAGKHLSRTSSHRKAMFSNMAASLFKHELIRTTLVKAKELRRVVEPLITLAKQDSVANRRLAFARTRDNSVVGKLFNELGPRYESRPGGYTRILKTGNRAGDNAEMAMIELVDFNEFFEGFNEDKKKSTTRRSRRGGASTPKVAAPKAEVAEAVVVAPAIEDAVVETVVAEEVVTETIVEVAAEEVVVETVAEVAAEEVAAPAEEAAPEAPADETPEAPAAEEGSEEETK